MKKSEASAKIQSTISQQQTIRNDSSIKNLYQSKIKTNLFHDQQDPIQLMAESPDDKSIQTPSSQKQNSLNRSLGDQNQISQRYSSPFPAMMPQWNENIEQSCQKKNKNLDHSPGMLILNSGSFKKILQREDQQAEQIQQIRNNFQNLTNHRLYDLQGNTICQFDPNLHDQNNPDFQNQLEAVIQDKQNDLPFVQNLQTPLKNKQLRSPLKDITPSITKRKKKSSALRTASYKNQNFLTPRTMAESRFTGSSGLRRIQRL